jgi:hypothetical protein
MSAPIPARQTPKPLPHGPPAERINLVLDWFEELKQHAPVKCVSLPSIAGDNK